MIQTVAGNTVLGLILLALIGCAVPVDTIHYVVLRDVPEKPSFVVLPAYLTPGQFEYADKIEVSLIKAGVKVVTRPPQKAVVTQKGIGAAEAQPPTEIPSVKQAGATMTESYYSYTDIIADYVVVGDEDSKRLKIIKHETQELLTSLELKPGRGFATDDFRDKTISDALKALGIKVKEQ